MNTILWIILGFIVIMIMIPIFVYVITKCFCDAKHKSKLEFLNEYKYLGGKNGKKEKFDER